MSRGTQAGERARHSVVPVLLRAATRPVATECHPQNWRPCNYTRRAAVFVLRCVKAGKGGLRTPRIPAMSALARLTQSPRTTTIVKVWDAECELWLERVIRKTHRGE
jgi:hypothetical protein